MSNRFLDGFVRRLSPKNQQATVETMVLSELQTIAFHLIELYKKQGKVPAETAKTSLENAVANITDMSDFTLVEINQNSISVISETIQSLMKIITTEYDQERVKDNIRRVIGKGHSEIIKKTTS